ncbi:MFS transporter [Actinopolyspora halophila]|uniref:MFS transporter n=1 Tax=Actinopolyspora halophila TaxID=1850 RepID=UPI0003811058
MGTFMLGGGRLGDLYGRHRLLRLGLAGFGLGSLLCALAPTLPLLVAARVLQGAGGSLIMPVGLALLTNIYPAPLRGGATGLALGLGGIAMACGPFLGGALTALVSWRAIFWINVPITVAAIWSMTATEESRDTSSPRVLDMLGLVLATVALACLAGYVDRAPGWGWASPGSLSLLLGVLAVGAAFLHHQRHAAAPLVNLTLFTNRPFVAVTASGAVANAATVVFLFVVPLSLQAPWGLAPVVAGVVFLVPSVLMAAAGPLAGRIRPKHAITAMAGALLVSAAALATAAHTGTLAVYVIAAGVCGAGLGLGNALTLTATRGMVEPARAGEAAGVTKTVITVAGGIGIVLVAPVADPHGPPPRSLRPC